MGTGIDTAASPVVTIDMFMAGIKEWDRQHKSGVRDWADMLTAVYQAMHRAGQEGKSAEAPNTTA